MVNNLKPSYPANKLKIFGFGFLVLLLLGLVASIILTRQSQDVRQQAYEAGDAVFDKDFYYNGYYFRISENMTLSEEPDWVSHGLYFLDVIPTLSAHQIDSGYTMTKPDEVSLKIHSSQLSAFPKLYLKPNNRGSYYSSSIKSPEVVVAEKKSESDFETQNFSVLYEDCIDIFTSEESSLDSYLASVCYKVGWIDTVQKDFQQYGPNGVSAVKFDYSGDKTAQMFMTAPFDRSAFLDTKQATSPYMPRVVYYEIDTKANSQFANISYLLQTSDSPWNPNELLPLINAKCGLRAAPDKPWVKPSIMLQSNTSLPSGGSVYNFSESLGACAFRLNYTSNHIYTGYFSFYPFITASTTPSGDNPDNSEQQTDLYAWYEARDIEADQPIRIDIKASDKNMGPVDGIQFSGTASGIGNIEGFDRALDIQPEQFSVPISVIENKIEFDQAAGNYQISLAIISAYPNQPLVFPVDGQVIGSLTFKTKPSLTPNQPITFDVNLDKTKMLVHTTGANLLDHQNKELSALVLDPYVAILSTAPKPTLTPTAIPTSVPTATIAPQPTLVPTAIPTTTIAPEPTVNPSGELRVLFPVEGFSSTTAATLPTFQAVLWDDVDQQFVALENSSLKVASSSEGLLFTSNYYPKSNHLVTLYLKLNKYHTLKHQFVLSENAATLIALSQPIAVGELTNDYIIDIEDYHQLVREFNPVLTQEGALSDLNYDGFVDVSDYALLAQNFDMNYQSPSLPQ